MYPSLFRSARNFCSPQIGSTIALRAGYTAGNLHLRGQTLLFRIKSESQSIKAQLTNQVANRVTSQLNRSFSFYDDWFDPLIGLRGRFNLNKAFYLTAESDVGGFGIGSDIAVQAYAALGCQITGNVFSEVGYRYLYDEFRDESAGDFLYKMSLHGAQITVGLTF